jgi:hypothetical protein
MTKYHSQCHCTIKHIKPSNHTLSLHSLTSTISYCKLNSQLIWEPRYIAMAWTRITGNTSHDRYCCVTSPRITENTCHVIPAHYCVTPQRMRCIGMVHARTRRKHFHSIVVWPVCWNVFNGLLPSNGLHNPVFLLLHVGPCLRSRCLEMRWANPLQYISNKCWCNIYYKSWYCKLHVEVRYIELHI